MVGAALGANSSAASGTVVSVVAAEYSITEADATVVVDSVTVDVGIEPDEEVDVGEGVVGVLCSSRRTFRALKVAMAAR